MKQTKETLARALTQAAVALLGANDVDALSEAQLELLKDAMLSTWGGVVATLAARRAAAPNKIRLAANGGELTSAGQAIVRARHASREAARVRRAKASGGAA